MWYSSKISTVENRCKPVFMTLKISIATNYLPCCCTPRVLAASTCFLPFCIISIPSVHMHGIILWMCLSFVKWHHVFIEVTPQALVWLKTTTQQQMSTQNSKQYVYFFLRQNELSFKQTLPKAQRTQGLSPSCQSNFLRSYHKFKKKSWAHFIFRIPSKHQLKISTKHQHLH